MRVSKRNRHRIIYSIIAFLLLIAGITFACLHHLSQQKEELAAYHNATPAIHIAYPRKATVWSITDTYSFPHNIPLIALLAESHTTTRFHSSSPSTLIAIYPDSTWAVWSAIHPGTIDNITTYFCDKISNGFTPVKEKKQKGHIYHFATQDNHFLHLYEQSGVIGYSYHEELLIHPGNDTTLHRAIEESTMVVGNRFFRYHNNKWQYTKAQ